MISKIKKKLQPLLYPLIRMYYSKPRQVSIRGIELKLYPTVFHPQHYLSTEIMLDFMIQKNPVNKAILEIGAGNGLVSIYLAKQFESIVTATDINKSALIGLFENAETNLVNLEIIESDIFDSLQNLSFDFILCNPPYYRGKAKRIDELAFYAGEKLEYFTKFFKSLASFEFTKNSQILMILSEHAELDSINKIAQEYSRSMLEVFKTNKNDEVFYIYQIIKS